MFKALPGHTDNTNDRSKRVNQSWTPMHECQDWWFSQANQSWLSGPPGKIFILLANLRSTRDGALRFVSILGKHQGSQHSPVFKVRLMVCSTPQWNKLFPNDSRGLEAGVLLVDLNLALQGNLQSRNLP